MLSCSGRLSGRMVGVGSSATARSIAFSSSADVARPGVLLQPRQGRPRNALRACPSARRTARRNVRPARGCLLALRSGGIRSGMTLIRLKEIPRNVPSATIFVRSRLVARGSGCRRRSLPCPEAPELPLLEHAQPASPARPGSSRRFHRGRSSLLGDDEVLLVAVGAVYAPRMWPNSSESSRVSEQRAAVERDERPFAPRRVDVDRARDESLPVPDSPVMSTVLLVGAIV